MTGLPDDLAEAREATTHVSGAATTAEALPGLRQHGHDLVALRETVVQVRAEIEEARLPEAPAFQGDETAQTVLADVALIRTALAYAVQNLDLALADADEGQALIQKVDPRSA